MRLNRLPWRSLRARMTLLTLATFFIGIWLLAIYAGRILHEDMERLVGDQQFSTVSVLAAQVNQDLGERMRELQAVAGSITPAMMKDAASLQKHLEHRSTLLSLFNAGAIVTRIDGTTTASIPLSIERLGVNYMNRDFIAAALKEGKTTIGQPVMGKILRAPIFCIGVPVRDARGNVIGALAGVTNLGIPNFMDKIMENRYGKTGGYFLVAPQYRLIVTASDKSRIMDRFPAPGVNPVMDKYIDGYEGSDVYVNPLGVEVLGSAKRIPVAEWFLGAIIPTREAFAPIQAMQQRMLLATILFTLLAGGLTGWTIWWMVRHQLSPMLTATTMLTTLSETNRHPRPLPVTSQDEIGQLIGGFNRLLENSRKREDALRESEERLRAILENAPALIFIKDPDGRFIHVNRLFEETFNVANAEIRGKTDHDIFPVEIADVLSKNDQLILRTGQSMNVEEQAPHADGIHTYLVVEFPLRASTGEIYALCCIATDITDKKCAEEENRKLEQQVQQAQKMESLGVLAGGIAHDFNNILMAVLGHTELAIEVISPMSPARGNLIEITTATRRAADLCRQMLAYAGKATFALEQVDLRELVEEMTHLLKTAISKKAILNLSLERDLPPVQADPSQIRQIVMNLIINASEAIGVRSGVITVSVGATRCDEEYLRKTELRETLARGLYVHLEVSDTGIGMDAETRSRIFEPFFSTKFTGRGLGLAAVMGIVRAHKGALKVYSEPGKGTTFKILFPAVTEGEDATRSPEPSPLADWQGEGTILFVDDEESLLGLGARILEHLGFTVLTASDGLQAVELYRARGREIDLVLMDLTMPHMDGAEAFGELRRINPDVRVVLASGYSREDVASRFVGKGPAGVLQKPYTLSKLREAFAAILPQRPQPLPG